MVVVGGGGGGGLASTTQGGIDAPDPCTVFEPWRCWKLSSLILFPGWCCVEWYNLSELWMMRGSIECGDLFVIC